MNKGATMRIIAIFGLALLPTFAWAGTGDPGHKHKTFSAGTPGDPSKGARTVEVTMREADGSMSFAPDRIEVRRGGQIKFALKNAGTQDHEFMLATKEENVTHGKLMERLPEMEHDDPNGKTARAANLVGYHLEIQQEKHPPICFPSPGPTST